VNVGATDPFKLPRADALQQSPARAATSPVLNADDLRLPRLKNGPDADVFESKAKAPANPPVSRVEKAPDTHFAGGKIVPPLNNDVAPTKTSLAEKVFGSMPQSTANRFSEAKLAMAKKPAPSSGLASLLLSFASLGALTSLVVGPAALIAKPGLMNHVVASLPTRLP
jgi:hypothetical protein